MSSTPQLLSDVWSKVFLHLFFPNTIHRQRQKPSCIESNDIWKNPQMHMGSPAKFATDSAQLFFFPHVLSQFHLASTLFGKLVSLHSLETVGDTPIDLVGKLPATPQPLKYLGWLMDFGSKLLLPPPIFGEFNDFPEDFQCVNPMTSNLAPL